MNHQTIIVEFIKKTSELLDSVGVAEEKSEIISKLTTTFIINLSELLSKKSYFKDNIKKSSETGINILKYLDQNNIDYSIEFEAAKKQTLEKFLLSSSSLFSPEKLAELNDIINS